MKIVTVLSLFLSFNLAWAQNTLRGHVSDSSGRVIPNVSITVQDISKSIIAFAITDSSGFYKLSVVAESDSVFIKANALNFKAEIRRIANKNQTMNFMLDEKITTLQEVVVKSQIITKSGDTISYDINSFANQRDRVLADVLKKMPGIKVHSDGTVLYNGEPVNKFYVNGKDLMEGRYGIINNSLPITSVSEVEVLENHQPVNILREKVPGEKAAINVKLKEKIAFTGEGKVGVGYTPFLRNIQLTPMFLSKKNQWLVSYKTNNNGESVENEDNILAFGNSYEGTARDANPISLLFVENSAVPDLAPEKYLMNNVHFVSANVLSTLGKDWELKTNIGFAKNKIDRMSFTKERYFESNIEGLELTKLISNEFNRNTLKGSATITKNAKELFFKNVTAYKMFWNSDSALVDLTLPNSAVAARQAIRSPTGSFQNSFSMIVPLGKKLINVQSYVGHQVDKQTLDIIPREYLQFYYSDKSPIDFGDSVYTMSQIYRLETFDLGNSASIKFSKAKWVLSADLGTDFSSKKLHSSLEGVTDELEKVHYGARFSNELKLNHFSGYVSTGFNFKNQTFVASLYAPIRMYHISAHNVLRDLTTKSNRLIIEPRLYMQKEFLSYWKAIIIAGSSTRFLPINELYDGYIMTSPTMLTIMNNESILARIISNYLNPRLEYRDPLSNLFFNVRFNYSLEDRNQMLGVYTDGNSKTIENVFRDNNVVSTKYGGEIGKFFPQIKSNLSLEVIYSLNRSEILFNDAIIGNNNKLGMAELRFNNKYYRWLSLDYLCTITRNKQYTSDNSVTTQTKYLVQKMDITFYVKKNHSLGINVNQYNTKLNSSSYNNFFYDLRYQHSWTKRKIDLELKWMNISNAKSIQQVILSPISSILNEMPLRHSYVMASVRFNF
jgi:hypothetical protein